MNQIASRFGGESKHLMFSDKAAKMSALLYEGRAGHCGGLYVSSESALYMSSGT